MDLPTPAAILLRSLVWATSLRMENRLSREGSNFMALYPGRRQYSGPVPGS